MDKPRLPVRELPYVTREDLAKKWAWDKGYPVPNKPGCLLSVVGVLGLGLAVIPGLLCLWIAFKKQRDYERDMRDLLMRWADAWEAARLDEEHEYRYYLRQERRRERALLEQGDGYEEYEEYEEEYDP